MFRVVVVVFAFNEPLEFMRRFHSPSRGVQDPIGDDHRVASGLAQHLIRLDVQRECLRIPNNLVDSNAVGYDRLLSHLRQLDYEDGAGGNAPGIDLVIKGDGDARHQVEAIHRVHHGEIVAVRRPCRAIRKRQVHPPSRSITRIRNGVEVAGERGAADGSQVKPGMDSWAGRTIGSHSRHSYCESEDH